VAYVIRMVLRHALKLSAAGIVVGGVCGAILSQAIRAFLYGVAATDLLTFLGVGAVLLASAAFAAWIPAYRAASVEPVIALRMD
jgi:putative ABC transport system permease protein